MTKHFGIEIPKEDSPRQCQPTQAEINRVWEMQLRKERRKMQPRKLFTEEEKLSLAKGIEIHGAGNWKIILEDKQFQFSRGRTNVDIKDLF